MVGEGVAVGAAREAVGVSEAVGVVVRLACPGEAVTVGVAWLVAPVATVVVSEAVAVGVSVAWPVGPG